MNRKFVLNAIIMVLFSNLLFVSNSNGQWLNKYYQVTGKLDRNFLKGFSLIDNMNPVGTYNYTYSKISQKNEVLVKEWFKYQQMKNLSPNDKIKAKIHNLMSRLTGNPQITVFLMSVNTTMEPEKTDMLLRRFYIDTIVELNKTVNNAQ